MKRLIMMVLCVFLLAGSAQAVTIEGMTLYDGSAQVWSTTNSPDWWVLGVSSDPGAHLLNKLDTTISGLAFGNYYLYAQPWLDMGSNPHLEVYLSDDLTHPITAFFAVSGTPGVANTWTRTSGNSAITLGWAAGAADLVGSGHSMVASGTDDFYMKVGISDPNPVPLPGAVWLLGTGLVGLAGLRRRFGR